MKVSNQPGYPLPDGELGEDEIVCQLVYLPDRPEYWQAFLGALHYMTTWKAWERDDDKRGQDAASNWREAFELTMECWRMTCLEDLQNNVAAILSLLQNQDPCCSDHITYYDSTTYITIIVPGDGDAPETYGETEVSDWDEWLEYLCHNSNLWVDELIRAATTIGVALDTGGLTIGLVAAVLTAVAFFFVGGVLALPFLMVIVFGLSANVSATIFEDAAVDLEDARDEIICAILSGRDVGQAVEDALSSGIAWDLLFSLIDYESVIGILYEGGDGEDTYLEAERDATCVCVCDHTFMFPGDNYVEYQSNSGSEVRYVRHTSGQDDKIEGTTYFNYWNPGGWCNEKMKVIDSASVSDGLTFARIITKDQNNDVIDDWASGSNACTIPISNIVGKTIASVFFGRSSPFYGGCGTGDIDITFTYHDAA